MQGDVWAGTQRCDSNLGTEGRSPRFTACEVGHGADKQTGALLVEADHMAGVVELYWLLGVEVPNHFPVLDLHANLMVNLSTFPNSHVTNVLRHIYMTLILILLLDIPARAGMCKSVPRSVWTDQGIITCPV